VTTHEHERHELPLADRIISKAIGDFITTNLAMALATNGYTGDVARGYAMAIDQARHMHLAGWDYQVVPKLADELRRAGLLTTREDA
jgi:hypothetical protein